MVEIREIRTSDAALLRDLHLRMYADAPDAFSETLAAAEAMSASDWQARGDRFAGTPEAVAFVAIWDGTAVGFVAGFVGRWRDGAMCSDARETVTMAKAWVDPRHRRTGVGRALASAVESWAIQKEARILEAQVTENNAPAIAFYEKLAFRDTGGREPLRSNPALQIHFLSRPLGQGAVDE
ncbi:MAG: GNAT family N-acetyltransferase [Sedimentisphaerales bacterium]|nr:GNAT family N-acetyltransferase [Sedimentisphaerales bacterium]